MKALSPRFFLDGAKTIIDYSIFILYKIMIEYKMNETVHRAAFKMIIRSVGVDFNPVVDDDEARVSSQ